MSLLDKASLIVTPNAYKTSKLYSVIPNTTLGDMDVVRATTATRVNSSGLIESVGLNIPRIDYTNGTCPSLLVEPQRTNLALNSDGNLSTYPTAINVTNASSSFNSFVNAIQFPSTGLALAYKSVVTTVQTYAISVFIKMDDNSVPILSASQTTGNMCLIIGGAIATNNLKVESYGNNVYRLSATATSAGINVNNGVIRYDTQVLKSFKITGIQLEAAGYSTSYIPTVASIQTRNADVISKTGISSLIGQTEGTIFVDFNMTNNDLSSNKTILAVDDNSYYVNIISPRILNTNALNITFRANSIGINFINLPIISNGNHKIVIKYGNGFASVFVDGIFRNTQVWTNSFSSSISQLFIGKNRIETPYFNDTIKSIQLYKTALTDAECLTLTTL